MTEKNLTAHYLSGLIAEKKKEQKQWQTESGIIKSLTITKFK